MKEEVLWSDSRKLLISKTNNNQANNNSIDADSYLEADIEPKCKSEYIENIVGNYSVVISQVLQFYYILLFIY